MNAWRQEANDFVRALSGAFLFGTPLLFTMEMWELGGTLRDWRLHLFLALALLAAGALAFSTGFRHRAGRLTVAESVEEGVDAVAVGIVASVAVLVALNRISFGDALGSAAGKVAVQTVPLALGASVANAVFARGGRQGDNGGGNGGDAGGGSGQGNGGEQGEQNGGGGGSEGAGGGGSGGASRAGGASGGFGVKREPAGPLRATLIDVAATVIGGIFVSVSIVPTDEISLLATGMTYWHELALIALTLAVTYAIVFASGFDPEGDQRPAGLFQHPASETAMAYLVSLGISLGALMLFNRVTADEPVGFVISQMLVLAFPAAIGGAAGRLVA